MSDDAQEALQRTTWTIFNLAVNLGLIASVIDQYPEHVQDGFIERLNMIHEATEKQIEEVQSFGEAYDEGEEE